MRPSRPSWLLVAVAVAVLLAYVVAAQVAVPTGVLVRAPTEGIKSTDVVNFSGQVVLLTGQSEVAIMTVPFGKRLIVTTYLHRGTQTPSVDLVEDLTGTYTTKLYRDFIYGSGPWEYTYAFPLGLRFEPGSTVALRTAGGVPASSDGYWSIVLVGALIDA